MKVLNLNLKMTKRKWQDAVPAKIASNETALSWQRRKMTKGSAAVVVVAPPAMSQISTLQQLQLLQQTGQQRLQAVHCSGGSANDNTFWRVSPPALRQQDDFANLDTEQGFRKLQN